MASVMQGLTEACNIVSADTLNYLHMIIITHRFNNFKILTNFLLLNLELEETHVH